MTISKSTYYASKPLDSLPEGQQALISRAKMLVRVNNEFNKLLPTSSQKHIVLMNIINNSVIIAADTAVQLTYLRFDHQNLLFKMKQIPGLEGITQLHFKVQPTAFIPQKNLSRKAMMSGQTSQMLRHSADGFDDPQLRSALIRLSKNFSSTS